MCYNCISTFRCDCSGGSVFALCPCQKGFYCSICGHDPISTVTIEKVDKDFLKDILKAEVYINDAEYKKFKELNK